MKREACWSENEGGGDGKGSPDLWKGMFFFTQNEIVDGDGDGDGDGGAGGQRRKGE